MFAQLDLAGSDAAAFLQGYATADLDGLRPDVATPMALCNIKGRVLANGWVAGTEEHVRLLIHAGLAEAVQHHLGKYLLFAKSKLARSAASIAFRPGHAPGGIALPPLGWCAELDAAADSGHAAFAAACVGADLPIIGAAVSETFLPQMLGLTDAGAVSFAKGCYLGQEVVARAEHLGEVKRKLKSFRFDGAAPQPGADVCKQGRKVGTVVAVGGGLLLASCRTDAAPDTAGDSRLIAD